MIRTGSGPGRHEVARRTPVARARILATARASLVALLAAGAVAGAGAPSAGARRGAAQTAVASCTPTPLRVHGHRALHECGPATATLRLAGHAFHFRGGSCETTSTVYLVALGTLVEGDPRHNEGRTSFDLTLTHRRTGLLEADVRGHALTLDSPAIMVPNHPGTRGRFASIHEPDSSLTYRGSWDCHGPVTTLR